MCLRRFSDAVYSQRSFQASSRLGIRFLLGKAIAYLKRGCAGRAILAATVEMATATRKRQTIHQGNTNLRIRVNGAPIRKQRRYHKRCSGLRGLPQIVERDRVRIRCWPSEQAKTGRRMAKRGKRT